MTSKPIVLILGSGPRVGLAVAKRFASKGYQIAIASRKGTNANDENSFLSLQADFAHPETLPALFDKIKQEFKASPNIVIYNASTATSPPDKENIFSIPTESVVSDLNVNTVSPYVAAQEAVKGWKTLGPDAKKVFIYTGNILNVAVWPVPLMFNGGMGKAASAYWIGAADMMAKGKGYRVFYADERYPDGKAKAANIDADAHADFYAELAEDNAEIPWHATFVKDKGYVKFQ